MNISAAVTPHKIQTVSTFSSKNDDIFEQRETELQFSMHFVSIWTVKPFFLAPSCGTQAENEMLMYPLGV